MEKECNNCHKKFYCKKSHVLKGEGKFCSKKCYAIWVKEQKVLTGKNNPNWKGGSIKKICPQCKQTYLVKRSGISSNKRKFCSIICRGLRDKQSGRLANNKNPSWKGGLVSKVCLVCGKEFKVYKCREKEAKYCSKKCWGVALKLFPSEKWLNFLARKTRKKRNAQLIKCENCSKEFYRQKSNISIQNFCSINCKNEYYHKNGKITVAKERNWNWKENRTYLYRTIRSCQKYRLWKEKVFRRDNFKCIWCQNTEKLIADHVKQFALIIFENNIKDLPMAYKCKELWDINNGRLLCLKCHYRTDTWGNHKF